MDISDPRNMKKHEIQLFFAHVKQRQEHHGAENAFRFMKALGKNQELVETSYPSSTPLQQDSEKLKKQRAKGKQKATSMELTSPVPNAPALFTWTPDIPAMDRQPAQSTSAQQPPASSIDSQTTTIDLRQRNELEAKGHPTIWASNGPADGFPVFAVPAMLAQQFKLLPVPSLSEPQHDIPIDPSLLASSPVPTRRYTRSMSQQKQTD
jgi:hypothetical protein